jgi:hypothetical protein
MTLDTRIYNVFIAGFQYADPALLYFSINISDSRSADSDTREAIFAKMGGAQGSQLDRTPN